MTTYLSCWTGAASALLAQALAGEPRLEDSLPKPLEGGSFGFAATIKGDVEGRFAVVLDQTVLASPLLGEGVEQKEAWGELLREIAGAAAGDLLAKSGQKCHVETFEPIDAESKVSRAFQLTTPEKSWTVLVRDDVRAPKPVAKAEGTVKASTKEGTKTETAKPAPSAEAQPSFLSEGLDLILDVELEATLRFGSRELPLGEILDLGPGDVVQLDRQVSDPIDLVIGDKIVARGEVVLVNGNFGLRVTEVATPRKRLETIRCLF